MINSLKPFDVNKYKNNEKFWKGVKFYTKEQFLNIKKYEIIEKLENDKENLRDRLLEITGYKLYELYGLNERYILKPFRKIRGILNFIANVLGYKTRYSFRNHKGFKKFILWLFDKTEEEIWEEFKKEPLEEKKKYIKERLLSEQDIRGNIYILYTLPITKRKSIKIFGKDIKTLADVLGYKTDKDIIKVKGFKEFILWLFDKTEEEILKEGKNIIIKRLVEEVNLLFKEYINMDHDCYLYPKNYDLFPEEYIKLDPFNKLYNLQNREIRRIWKEITKGRDILKYKGTMIIGKPEHFKKFVLWLFDKTENDIK